MHDENVSPRVCPGAAGPEEGVRREECVCVWWGVGRTRQEEKEESKVCGVEVWGITVCEVQCVELEVFRCIFISNFVKIKGKPRNINNNI